MFKSFKILALMAALVMGASSLAFAQGDGAEPTVTFRLTTALGAFEQGPFAFVGLDGELADVANPELRVKVGDVVEVVLVNGDGMPHDFTIEDLGVHSEQVASVTQEVRVVFTVTEAGEFEYFCSIPGHRQGGMFGKLIVEAAE